MTSTTPLLKNVSNLGIKVTTKLKTISIKFYKVFFHAPLSLDLKQFTVFDSKTNEENHLQCVERKGYVLSGEIALKNNHCYYY